MTSRKDIKFGVVVAFGLVYFVSFWLLTIGYFTPYWLLINLSSGDFDSAWISTHTTASYYSWIPWKYGSACNSVGLVKPTMNCDESIYDWFETSNIHSIRTILRPTFILMTTAVVVVYTNAMMLITAVVFDLFHYSLYMSLLSISFGVFCPIAAVLILVATIYVEAAYTTDTGYSPMLCTVSGCLMLIFYISLIVYDRKYIQSSTTSKPKEKSKHAAGGNKRGSRDTTKHDPTSFETKLKRDKVQPVRNWGLRRK
ncbi:uncharacterized protein LOC128557825 isoform X1 [Mercenaria mercenaria]|uniref:uncharacterized protein LOC128557825 isoform X1 n=1 Tax=Mercenaria mercenaria TaxID=6596 RepID=UPI00234F6A96|nr:uncharacterized protein LOC128557825 isoform X1 [Mercenaria mercenaria]